MLNNSIVAAQRLRSVALTPADSTEWSSLQWRRRIEHFGEDGRISLATAPDGTIDGICQSSEITDAGRRTTYDLGRRLRHLYVDQLGFMPRILSDPDIIHLRATPLPRALESLQQTFVGMYPLTARTMYCPHPTIVTREYADETLLPNDINCQRFVQLSKAFAQRAADRWNDSDDMRYVSKLIGKWMPENKVGVDSSPPLIGIMDTIYATLAHGPKTRLPSEFYDDKAIAIIDRIASEEWYAGYSENNEYRTLGIGELLGDVVERMAARAEETDRAVDRASGYDRQPDTNQVDRNVKFTLGGCHDTTIAAILYSMGAVKEGPWPSYTCHVAVELFKKIDETADLASANSQASPERVTEEAQIAKIGRKPYRMLSNNQKDKIRGYYVRLRYNDKVMHVPGCKAKGKHLDGDEGFCTLEAFKRIADSFTPKNWKQECAKTKDGNIDTSITAAEWAGSER